MNFDFRNEYEWELEYKEALRAAVATPVGILTGIGTLIGFMILRFQYSQDLYYTIFFVVLCGAAACSLAVAVYALARTSHGNVYKRVEYASGLQAFHTQLTQWHRLSLASRDEDIERDFKEYLDSSYAKASEHNAKVNEARADYLFIANRCLLASAVFTALAFAPYFYNFETQPQKPQLVILEANSVHPK
ncbi:MAG TPA: hypothetical protein VF651_06380 [Gammaproteobacteria bacterium]